MDFHVKKIVYIHCGFGTLVSPNEGLGVSKESLALRISVRFLFVSKTKGKRLLGFLHPTRIRV